MSHSRGPWEVAETGPSKEWGGGVTRIRFADAPGLVCEIPHPNWPEQQANARLIAESPALLDACNGLIGLIQLLTSRDDAPDWLKAATENHRFKTAVEVSERATGAPVTP